MDLFNDTSIPGMKPVINVAIVFWILAFLIGLYTHWNFYSGGEITTLGEIYLAFKAVATTLSIILLLVVNGEISHNECN